MTSAPSVVHVAPTPLVASPGKISRILNREGTFRSHCLVLSDYPKALAGKFLLDAILWQPDRPHIDSLAERLLREAAVVHVHNSLPPEVVDKVADWAQAAHFIYQVHSPLREGPIYVSREHKTSLPYSARLVVGQYQPRHYPDYTPVPNLVDADPSCAPLHSDKRPRVLFSPAHGRGGRWNRKKSIALDGALDALHNANLIEAVVPDNPLPPNELMALRRTTHISIDEIATGAFHQVSLEAMCAGNVVVNNADHFSIAMFQRAVGAHEDPPFVRCHEGNVFECLHDLVSDRSRVVELQERSAEFFASYLAPDKLIQTFVGIYRKTLDAKDRGNQRKRSGATSLYPGEGSVHPVA